MHKVRYLLVLLAMLVSTASPVVLPTVVVMAQEIGTATTTDRLNLRSGPSLSDPVTTVIPLGAEVSLTGRESNGFRSITYNGREGWAFATYLAIAEAPASPRTAATTTDSLNLRTGPGTSYPVMVVMPVGAQVTLTGRNSNGFQSLTYSGFSGWASASYLQVQGTTPQNPPVQPTPPATGTATTTDSLNLRAGAGTSFTVVTVMPRGASVTLTGQSANGFHQIGWNGQTGWASGQYLDFGSTTPTPPPPVQPDPTPPPSMQPPASPSGTAVTTDSLNLRVGPRTTERVVVVMPAQSRVVLTGRSQNNFLELSYNGKTGWAHRDYLAIDGTTLAPSTSAVTTDSLNMRSGPATSYEVLTLMPRGAKVTLTGQTNNGFHSVSYNGFTGWAFSAYLNLGTGSVTPPRPAPTPTQPPAPTPTQPPAPTPTISPPPPADIVFDGTNSIIGPVRGTPEEAIAFASRAGALHMDEVERYIHEVYRLAPQIGFDPAIIISQSALETGYWKSPWWETRLNPAGLGITGDPRQENTSPVFESGIISARAQLAHMHAEVYGNKQPLPTDLQGVDPTYQHVFNAGWAGTIVTIEDLSGTWAVDPLYHTKIVRVANEIFG